MIIVLVIVIGGGVGSLFLFFHNKEATNTTATSSQGRSPGRPPAGDTALGDLSTLDPCSLVDTSKFGATADAVPYDLSACLVLVTSDKSDQVIQVTVTLSTADLSMADSTYVVTKEGKATLVKLRKRDDDTACYTDVFFNATDFVLIGAKPDSQNTAPTTSAALCRAADTAAETVAVVVNSGSAKHLNYPASSMGTIDSCTVLSSDPVHTAIGGTGIGTPSLGNHTCSWGNMNSQDQPSATFGTELDSAPQSTTDNAGETEQEVSGRPTLVIPGNSTAGGRLSTCKTDTMVHTWPSWPGQMTPYASGSTELVEYAHLSVRMSGTQAQACQAAITLATLAWPKLPAAS